ncbi:hypothetical protein Poli38472_002242 [Pythium oligandrum]|uniref:PNPLA domain-containing protein n=1 Tax=Pythium oligandrum TaxID=41045 RepID=A0A8K1FI08_PYTOL|nr:hypothetical protein Poli38472_002242 [Pythium oligandrum]|eukprot:TMW63301.1 hypothetical protein Poli38472_002242 [Pythium oligandrum]
MTTESYSFACGGWLKMYLFGVAKALQEHELEKNARVIGCSAGALAATALALGCDFDAIRDFVVDEVVPKAHENLSGPFQVRSYLQATLRSVGHLDRYEELNQDTEKLSVVYSSLSAWASRRVTRFESQEHLEKSLLASCCAVPIAGMPFKLSGEWVMDGGVFDFQPVFDAHTVTVSAFYCTAADIKPSRYVPMWWAFYPPSQRDVEWLFELGYEDGLAWIAKTGKSIKTIEMPTKGASYDGQWTTTVGRVVGYRGVESRILDMLFVGLFVCLWKPLAFVLLYLELYLHAIVSGGKAALFGAAAKLMISSIILVGTILAMATHSFHDMMVFMLCLLGMGIFLGVLVLLSGGIQGAAMVASKDWRKCRACMRNITSLSLFLRTVPVYGSSIVIKRHEYLLEHSMVYRLAMHFV